MDLPEEAKRAPFAPVWNQSFPSPRRIFLKRLSELHLPRFEMKVFLLLRQCRVYFKIWATDVIAFEVSMGAVTVYLDRQSEKCGAKWCSIGRSAISMDLNFITTSYNLTHLNKNCWYFWHLLKHLAVSGLFLLHPWSHNLPNNNTSTVIMNQFWCFVEFTVGTDRSLM